MSETNSTEAPTAVQATGGSATRPVLIPSQREYRSRRPRSSTVPVTAPDLAAIAKAAVNGFLHDASAATAQRASTQADEAADRRTAVPAAAENAAPAASRSTADPLAWRAAAVSIATLERIETAAAKLEADIAAARQAQAELYAEASTRPGPFISTAPRDQLRQPGSHSPGFKQISSTFKPRGSLSY